MLCLLSAAKWVTLSSLAQPRRLLPLFNYQPAIPLPIPHQPTISLHQSGPNMSNKKGTEAIRSGIQLKTPKGTVDSFGKEVILRDQVT